MFLGDFIDRGDEILEVVTIVKTMIDIGNAYSVIGNHEYNYFHLFDEDKKQYCRPHNEQHNRQIAKTLSSFSKLSLSQKEKWMRWFYNLPMYLEFDHFRIAHAFWNDESIAKLKTSSSTKKGKFLSRQSILLGSREKTLEKKHIELILIGSEIPLTKNQYFYDEEKKYQKIRPTFLVENTKSQSQNDRRYASTQNKPMSLRLP